MDVFAETAVATTVPPTRRLTVVALAPLIATVTRATARTRSIEAETRVFAGIAKDPSNVPIAPGAWLSAVESATVIMDRATGRSKGFGFVEMSSDAEAQAAIDLWNGKDFGGRNLTVSEARPLEPRN